MVHKLSFPREALLAAGKDMAVVPGNLPFLRPLDAGTDEDGRLG